MKINFLNITSMGNLKKIFKSNYLTSGPVCRKFEK